MARTPGSLAPEEDWQFAYERCEMMREFQMGLLISIGHELRNPLSSQIGSLQMILCDLCDSPEEEREFLETSKQSVEKLVRLLEEYSHLVRYPLPIQSLQPTATDLMPLLGEVYHLTRLQAQDQGLRYPWPDLDRPAPTVMITADPMGFSQALLGLCWWSIRQLQYGTLQVGGLEIEEESYFYHSHSLCFPLRLTGLVKDPVDPTEHPHWWVCKRLLQEMHGDLTVQICQDDRVEIEIRLQRS